MNIYTAAAIGWSLVVSLVLTVVMECAASLAFGIRNRKDMILICLVNVLTNPVVVLITLLTVTLCPDPYRFFVIPLLELLAVLIEGYYYKKYGAKIKRPFLLSMCLNLLSYGIGAVISKLL